MSLDRALPPSQLPTHPNAAQIARYFAERCGVRVDLAGLDMLPAYVRLSLQGARLPEPPEAAMLDRVLQLIPTPLLKAVDRVPVVDTGETGRPGSYDARIIRVRTPALKLRNGDPEYGKEFSIFTTTVIHELGHAVYEELLTDHQRDLVLASYVAFLDQLGTPPADEPTDAGVQNHFVALLLTVLLGRGTPFRIVAYAQSVLDEVGLSMR
jgi:hypothetical protein